MTTIVAKGLGLGGQGSLVLYGMGQSQPTIVIPVTQVTEAKEALFDAGVAENELVVTVAETAANVAVIEVNVSPDVLTPSQISSVLSRSLNVEVKEVKLQTGTKEVTQTAEFTDIVMSVSVEENGIDVVVVTADEDIEIYESIDKDVEE